MPKINKFTISITYPDIEPSKTGPHISIEINNTNITIWEKLTKNDIKDVKKYMSNKANKDSIKATLESANEIIKKFGIDKTEYKSYYANKTILKAFVNDAHKILNENGGKSIHISSKIAYDVPVEKYKNTKLLKFVLSKL